MLYSNCLYSLGLQDRKMRPRRKEAIDQRDVAHTYINLKDRDGFYVMEIPPKGNLESLFIQLCHFLHCRKSTNLYYHTCLQPVETLLYGIHVKKKTIMLIHSLITEQFS